MEIRKENGGRVLLNPKRSVTKKRTTSEVLIAKAAYLVRRDELLKTVDGGYEYVGEELQALRKDIMQELPAGDRKSVREWFEDIHEHECRLIGAKQVKNEQQHLLIDQIAEMLVGPLSELFLSESTPFGNEYEQLFAEWQDIVNVSLPPEQGRLLIKDVEHKIAVMGFKKAVFAGGNVPDNIVDLFSEDELAELALWQKRVDEGRAYEETIKLNELRDSEMNMFIDAIRSYSALVQSPQVAPVVEVIGHLPEDTKQHLTEVVELLYHSGLPHPAVFRSSVENDFALTLQVLRGEICFVWQVYSAIGSECSLESADKAAMLIVKGFQSNPILLNCAEKLINTPVKFITLRDAFLGGELSLLQVVEKTKGLTVNNKCKGV